MMKLFSKNSNLCDHNSPTLQTDRQTDRQTTCDRNIALCTKVHRAVKMPRLRVIISSLHDWGGDRAFPVGAVCAYRRQRWHVDFQVSLYKYNDEVHARLTRTCCNVCVRFIFYRKIKSLNRFTSLSCLLDVKCSCVSVLQYYEMSYGLNVEMHKQVSPQLFNLDCSL